MLYVYARDSRFVAIDRDVLRRRWNVVDWSERRPLRTLRAVARANVVVVWFAGWHALVPLAAAWLLRRPSLVITGGYDVADVPEAGYGMQRGGAARWASRWALRRATRLMANSFAGAAEALRAAPRAQIDVVHHGVPDLVGGLREAARSGALTVGAVDRRNLLRKGLLPFVEAAAALPAVPFALVGQIEDDAAADELRARAGPNVEIAGRVDDDQLAARYAAASVYVQASLHEGFGMAVAEAMLAGCIPVVTAAGALPEVVGDTGVTVPAADAAALAPAIERALALGDEARARVRERVLRRFRLQDRATGLLGSVEAVLGRALVRPARPEDAEAIARVHVDSWRAGYRGLVVDRVLDTLDVDRRAQQWEERIGQGRVAILVAEHEARVAGFAAVGLEGFDETAPEGEATVAALYVAPDLWGRGFGGALLDEGLQELRELGMRTVRLWVIEGNDRGRGFYERRGFVADGAFEYDEERGAAEHRLVLRL